jgi:hypothetical protein
VAEIFSRQTVEEVEREHILLTLHHCRGNRTRAAKALGISLRGLRLKIRCYKAAGFHVPEPPIVGPASAGGALEGGRVVPFPRSSARLPVHFGVATATLPSASLERKQRGRPRSGQNPLLHHVRLPLELIELLSRRALAEATTRSELIRRLIELGLRAECSQRARRTRFSSSTAPPL